MILDRIGEQLVLHFAQFNRAVIGFRVIALECDVHAAEFKLHAEYVLAQCLMVVVDGGFRTRTERQAKKWIRFLSIMIGPNGVHPQHDFFILFILFFLLNKTKYKIKFYIESLNKNCPTLCSCSSAIVNLQIVINWIRKAKKMRFLHIDSVIF